MLPISMPLNLVKVNLLYEGFVEIDLQELVILPRMPAHFYVIMTL